MDTVKVLVPIVRKACNFEDSGPEFIGQFLRTICLCAEMESDKIQILFEHIFNDLLNSQLLESCEFHEGLDGLLEPRRMVQIIIGAYLNESEEAFSTVLTTLCSSSSIELDKDCWRLVRSNMSAVQFRAMLVRIVELSCDNTHAISTMLEEVYERFEEFEIAETIRLILDTHWLLDIIPQKRKKARKVIEEYFLVPFPFAQQIVDEFLTDVLRFDDIDQIRDSEKISDQISVDRVSASSDSDVESRGSLEDFVVDDSESSVSSSSSDDKPKQKHKKQKR